MMVKSDLYSNLPRGDELPDSADIPVDNEDQNLIPNILLFVLKYLWASRNDWYFGVDMGIYHNTGVHPRVPIIPDGFLSLGVERRKGGKSRRSYVVWEENEIVPIVTLEVVSWTPGGEYDEKLEIYRKLGVLYYIIYNPEFWQRDRQQPFEVYKLINGDYQLQIGEPYWMPEVGLGIGRWQSTSGTVQQEVLGWFNEQRTRYLAPEEWAERADRLAARLRALGEDPDRI